MFDHDEQDGQTARSETETPAIAETPAIVLGPEHDLEKFASPDAQRYALNAVHIDPVHDVAEATDGKILVRVPLRHSNGTPFPRTPGAAGPVDKPVLVPAKFLAEALRQGPKTAKSLRKWNGEDPLYANTVRVTLSEKPLAVVLSRTNLEEHQDRSVAPHEGKFPDVEDVFPGRTRKPVAQFRLAAGLLKTLADYAAKHSTDEYRSIEFSVYAPDEDGPSKGLAHPVEWRFGFNAERPVVGLVMPVVMTND